MKSILVCLVLLLATPINAEPGVAILQSPRSQELSQRARRFCYLLIKQNKLADYQFSLKTIDLSTPDGRRFAREFQLSEKDLPALGYYEREGNRIRLHNLIRNYKDPQKAAEDAFRCARTDHPELIRSADVLTGVYVLTGGARVLKDGTELGVGPCQLDLPPGRHELELVDPYCAPERRTFNLKAGDNPEWAPRLTRCPTEMTLESAGAPLELFLDGKYLGTTPVTATIDAGRHELEATSNDTFPIHTELTAEPNRRMLARLKPTPARVRVAWVGMQADGYDYSYTVDVPIVTDWNDCSSSFSWATPAFYSIPIPVEGTVELSQETPTLNRAELLQVHEDENWDCALELNLRSSEWWVIGELSILGPDGKAVQTFEARRDMPWLTFDSQGAARKRAEQVVRELLDQGLPWIGRNVQPSGLSEEEQRSSLELTTLK